MNKMLLGLLRKILDSISPNIREFIETSVKELAVKAKATPNPYDDVAVEILAWVLCVELPDDD